MRASAYTIASATELKKWKREKQMRANISHVLDESEQVSERAQAMQTHRNQETVYVNNNW